MKSNFAAALVTLAAALPAQANGVTLRNYGTTCDVYATPSRIRGSYDVAARTLTVTVERSATCCNTFLANQWLLVGVQIEPGLSLDFAGFVPGCRLAVLPYASVARVQGTQTWSFRLPPLTPGSTFWLQGVNDYFTTIGFTHDWQTSDGLEVVIV